MRTWTDGFVEDFGNDELYDIYGNIDIVRQIKSGYAG